MIMGRIHLILSFYAESQNSSKQILTVLVGTNISLFIHFLNFVFKRLKHFDNHFWFWWYVIQQPLTKIFSLLHAFRNDFFVFRLTFIVIFDGLQGVGCCKTGVGSFGIDSSNMLLFCSTYLAASKTCINCSFLSL